MSVSILSGRRLRILEVIGNAIVGGMEAYVERLLGALPRERFETLCVCPFESPFTAKLRALGCEVFITRMGDDPPWESIRTVATLVRTRGIEIMHAHLANAHQLAALAGRLTHCPVLATVHGLTLVPLDLEVHRAAETYLTVVSQHSYLSALAQGVAPERLHLVPNGIDTRLFTPQAPSGRLRGAIGVSEEVPLIGYVGRLSSEKGPEVFLRAAAAAREWGCPARFLMIGDGPLRATMEAAIRESRLEDTVHLMGLLTDMPQVYADLDLIVSTSHAEGLSLALMEAMACGRPLIATQVGGSGNLVEVDTTGYLVPPNDPRAVAHLLKKCLADPGKLRQMGAAARERAEREFAFAQTVDGMARLLTKLAAGALAEGRRMNGTRAPRASFPLKTVNRLPDPKIL